VVGKYVIVIDIFDKVLQNDGLHPKTALEKGLKIGKHVRRSYPLDHPLTENILNPEIKSM
jgi:hypothetical protein